MTTLTLTGKTGDGSQSLSGTFTADSIALQVTAITNPKVGQGTTVNGAKKIQYAGSCGFQVLSGGVSYVDFWTQIPFDAWAVLCPVPTSATHVWWRLRPGVTATLNYNYH